MHTRNPHTEMSDKPRSTGETVVCAVCAADDASELFTVQGRRIVRCRRCGLVYVNPRPEGVNAKELYGDQYFASACDGEDASATRPQHDYFSHHQAVQEISRFEPELAEISMLCGGGRILDVGCSTGRFLGLAKKAGWETFGVEVSALAAAYARETYGVEVVTGELRDAPFSPQSFDVMTLHHVLEHLHDPVVFLREGVYPLLKPGGLLVIEVPNYASLESIVNKNKWQDLRPLEHLYHFAPNSLRLAIRSAGFQVHSIRTKTGSAGLKPSLCALGVPTSWLASVRPPSGWWDDVAAPVSSRPSLYPNVRRSLLAALRLLELLPEKAGLGKRLVGFARRPSAIASSG